jgi:large subunit ribosomal protein L7/L12
MKASGVSVLMAVILAPALFVLSNFCSYVIGHSPHFDLITGTCSAVQGLILWINIVALAKLIESLRTQGPGALALASAGTAAAALSAESTEFTVTLKADREAKITYPANRKIAVIKVLRDVAGLEIRDGKELVEGESSPVRLGISDDEVEIMKRKLEDIGARMEIQ